MDNRITEVAVQRSAWDASAMAGLGLASWLLSRVLADSGAWPLLAHHEWYRLATVGAALPLGWAAMDWRRWRDKVAQLRARAAAKGERDAAVERYGKLFAGNPQPMWVIDAETLGFMEVNDAACQAYGYSREEFEALTVADLRLPGEMEDARRRVGMPQPVDGFVTRHRKRDGDVIEVEIISHALQWRGRNARMAIARDVSRRLETERTLQESERRYRQLFEHNLAGVFRVAADGRLLEANEALARMLGFASSTELVATETHYLFATTAERRRWIDRMRTEGNLNGVELELQHRDGRKLSVLTNQSLLQEGSGESIEGTVIDITERKTLEEQFRQAQKMEAVGRLAAGVAHDFNNLLTVVNGYSDLLLAKEAAAEFHPKLRMIRKAGEKAATLTQQLLAFGRQQVLQARVLDLNAVVGEARATLRTLMGEGMEVAVELAAEALPVMADAGQIEQVLMNLAVNARDAMPGGGKLTVELKAVWLDENYARLHPDVMAGAYVMLAVTDTGTGMTEAVQAHLFEPFFSTKPKGQATGLGLATVFGIVKQSGGSINAYSEPGLGTSIKIYFPRVQGETAAECSSEAVVSARGGSETVLIVEDEEDLRGLTRELLAAMGYRLLLARDPAAAIALSRETAEPIDLLLTDVVMPGMNGRALAKILSGERPGLRVLYMSGYPDHAITHGGALDQDLAFLPKPFSAQALAQKIRAVLDAPLETLRTH